MKQLFFTPGPSQLYPTVPMHIQNALEQKICSISHRSQQFEELFSSTTKGLRKLLTIPEEYAVVFVGSGTEAMERIVENTVEKSSFHLVNGSFSRRWFEIAQELGKDAKKKEAILGKGFSDIPKISKVTELICFTHNETSSGVALLPEFMYEIKNKYPQALIAVDTVSSSPYVNLDYKKLDCVFFSVQKLFGSPAGLGVIILSPQAIEKAHSLQKKRISIGSYHTFPTLITWAQKNQTPETPNVLGIYLLNEVVNDFLKKGIGNIRKETEQKAETIYAFLDTHITYTSFVEKLFRSSTVIVAEVGDSLVVQNKLRQKGFIVGGGYGSFKERQIRIANFPAITMGDIENLLQEL